MEDEKKKSHLTIKEVAERWGVSVNFVRRLIWDRKLGHTRFGRAIRVSHSTVKEYSRLNTERASNES